MNDFIYFRNQGCRFQDNYSFMLFNFALLVNSRQGLRATIAVDTASLKVIKSNARVS